MLAHAHQTNRQRDLRRWRRGKRIGTVHAWNRLARLPATLSPVAGAAQSTLTTTAAVSATALAAATLFAAATVAGAQPAAAFATAAVVTAIPQRFRRVRFTHRVVFRRNHCERHVRLGNHARGRHTNRID